MSAADRDTRVPGRPARAPHHVVLAALLILGAALAVRGPERLESWTLDQRAGLSHAMRSSSWFRGLVPARPRTREVVIVAIDDDTLTVLGERYPVRRRHLARLIDVARGAGASVVAMDLFLLGRSTEPEDDRLLAAAIQASGRVLFGQRWLRRSGELFTRPNDAYFATGMLGEGTVLFSPGTDGVIRHAQLFHQVADGKLPSLPLLAAIHHWRLKTSQYVLPATGEDGEALLLHDPEGRPGTGEVRLSLENGNRLLLDFAGPEGPCRVVPFHELEKALAREPDLLRGRVVLAGVTASAAHDEHPVSTGNAGRPTQSGVGLHAQALAQILTGSPMRRAPLWAERLALALLGLACAFLCATLPPGRAAAVAAGLAAAWSSCAIGAYLAWGLWISMTTPVLLVAVLWVHALAVAAARGRRVEPLRAGPRASEQRLTDVRRLLSTGGGDVVPRLQNMLRETGELAAPEVSWGLAMAFLSRGEVTLGAPHALDAAKGLLPLADLDALSRELEKQGALDEAVRVLERILSRDIDYPGAADRVQDLQARDRMVPDALRKTLAHRYADVAYLGSGGMARVYSATDQKLGLRVAIKVPDADLMSEADTARRFHREIQSLAEIDHPHVVRVHDVCTEGIAYYAMDLIEGETLRAWLDADGRLHPARAVAWLEPIADALAQVHARGIVHRDLKPENLLVRADDTLCLTDFGVAFFEDQTRLTKTSAYVGTPAYMAPEQLQGDRPTTQVDVYAFGLVLYELITGTNPYFSGNVARKLVEPPPSPRERVPDLPAPLEDLIMRCLARDPSMRPADGAALHRELARLEKPAT